MENNNSVYTKLFMWLFIGLLLSFGVGYYVSNDYSLLLSIINIGLVPIIIVEVGIAFVLSLLINKLSPLIMKILYLVYCFVTGLTLSTIFVVYEMSSVISIFFMTAIIFAIMALYGIITKKDLTKLGTFLFLALIGIIVSSLLNMLIFQNEIADMTITWIGVGVFTLFIAYDIQKVKHMINALDEEKAAVYGAFQLYLDFINLFIRLLRLLGKAKD